MILFHNKSKLNDKYKLIFSIINVFNNSKSEQEKFLRDMFNIISAQSIVLSDDSKKIVIQILEILPKEILIKYNDKFKSYFINELDCIFYY